MKRKIIITLLAMLMLTIFSVTAFAYTLGDVNGDSKITAADARIALRYAAKLEKLPKCTECDEPIQDDCYYEINGECVCPECLDNNHKHWVEDYIE